MQIGELQDVAPPPGNPVDSGRNQNWGAVTDYFGKPLPMDYMEFVDCYGTVLLNNYLHIFNPFSGDSGQNLIAQFSALLSLLSQNKEEFPEICPYPLMFEPGGLLPWGVSVDADIFCWSTAGMSGKWKTIVLCRQGAPEEFDVSMVEFLVKSISGELRCGAIPIDWSESPSSFEPYSANN